jgi:hypothetical protein
LARIVNIAKQALETVAIVTAGFPYVEGSGLLALSREEASVANRVGTITVREALGTEVEFGVTKGLVLAEKEETFPVLATLDTEALVGIADQAVGQAGDIGSAR